MGEKNSRVWVSMMGLRWPVAVGWLLRGGGEGRCSTCCAAYYGACAVDFSARCPKNEKQKNSKSTYCSTPPVNLYFSSSVPQSHDSHIHVQ